MVNFILSEERKSKRSGIYRISFDDGWHYIGKTCCFSDRFTSHMADIRRGFRSNKSLRKMKGYVGDITFEIVEYVDSFDDLREREIFHIQHTFMIEKRLNHNMYWAVT